MLQPFNTLPHLLVTLNPKIMLLLFHNCNFVIVLIVMNGTVNILYAG